MNRWRPGWMMVGCVTVLAAPVAAEDARQESTSRPALVAEQFTGTVQRAVEYQYWLYLPDAYAAQAEPWPLLLFLHGSGERGTNLDAVKRHGPPKLIDAGRALPFIVVAPQCPAGRWWDVEALVALLDHCQAKYRVDPRRVYVTGLSMGGYGTWELAIKHAERIAAIVPICGGGVPYRAAERLKEVPVWAFHGAKDLIVPLRNSQEMVDWTRRGGGDAKLTVYPEAGHDAWTLTYDNPEVFTWLLSHRKPEPPTATQPAATP